MTAPQDEFAAIVGEQLSSVEFVQDYLQLHFDGRFIIAFSWPTVCLKGTIFRFEQTGYRDSLCAVIGRNVARVALHEGESIKIEFDDASTIEISLRQTDRVGPEAALYRAGTKSSDPIMVF